MAIKEYFKQEANGKKVRLYMVTAEAMNVHTSQRRSKKRRGITRKSKAEKIYKEIWNQCRNETPDKVLKGETSQLGQLVDEQLSNIERKIRSRENPEGFSPGTLVVKRRAFKYLDRWRDLDVEQVTPVFLNKALDGLEKDQKLSQLMAHTVFVLVKSLFYYAQEVGLIQDNPLSGCRNRPCRRKKQIALNHREANFLLEEAHKRTHPYYFVWLLALTLGLRRSELAGLKWSDVDFEQRILYVQRQLIPGEGLVEKTKSSKDRAVAIPKQVVPILKDFQSQSKSDFIINMDKSSWSEGNQARVTRNFCRKIGIKEVTFHQLRATHITLAIQDGVSIGAIMSNVGHSSLATTNKYFRLSGVSLRGETDCLKLALPQS